MALLLRATTVAVVLLCASALPPAEEQLPHEQLQHEQLSHEQLQHEQLSHEQLQHEQLSHEQLQHEQLPHGQLRHGQLGHEQLMRDEENHVFPVHQHQDEVDSRTEEYLQPSNEELKNNQRWLNDNYDADDPLGFSEAIADDAAGETDEDYSEDEISTDVDDEDFPATRVHPNPHFKSLLHGNDIFNSFSQREASNDMSQFTTQENGKISFTVNSEQNSEDEQFDIRNNLLGKTFPKTLDHSFGFSQHSHKLSQPAKITFANLEVQNKGKEFDMTGLYRPEQQQHKSSITISSYRPEQQSLKEVSNTINPYQTKGMTGVGLIGDSNQVSNFQTISNDNDLYNRFSQQEASNDMSQFTTQENAKISFTVNSEKNSEDENFPNRHNLLGKTFPKTLGNSFGFFQHTHKLSQPSKISFGNLEVQNNEKGFDMTGLYRPEQQHHTSSNTMNSYSPQQQPLKEISNTINPYKATEMTSEGLMGGSNQVSNFQTISNLLLSGGGHQVNHPTSFSRVTKSEVSADMSKALHLMHFLTNIDNMDINSHGNTAILQLLSRQPAKLIRPIIRFIAVQKTSPHNHWQDFLTTMKSKNSAEAYMTLMNQINIENRRQSFLMRKLRLLTKQMKQRKEKCLYDASNL